MIGWDLVGGFLTCFLSVQSRFAAVKHFHKTRKILNTGGSSVPFFKMNFGSTCCGAAETNSTRNHEVAGSIPGLVQWVKDLVLL